MPYNHIHVDITVYRKWVNKKMRNKYKLAYITACYFKAHIHKIFVDDLTLNAWAKSGSIDMIQWSEQSHPHINTHLYTIVPVVLLFASVCAAMNYEYEKI